MECFTREAACVGEEVRQTQLHPHTQLMSDSSKTWVCSARKQGDALIPLSVSCEWGKLLQSEGSNFQLCWVPLTHTRATLQMQHPSHTTWAWLDYRGRIPPCWAALESRNKLPVLCIVIILSLRNPLLLPSSPHPQEAPVRLILLNLGHEFLFPSIFKLLFLLLAGCPSTLHICRQFSFWLPEREKKNLCIVYPGF